jgi:endonuclease YncB( thermonuclease family)
MPGMELNDERIRVDGINAPELGTPEGYAAKSYAETLLSIGARVTLTITRRDKYGRVLAKIKLPDGRDFGAAMISAKCAVPYDV